ncbi:MAG: hypothetical protein HY427_00955, partial [Candidatus Levybacteria bacterium]|nr:hypothetical protein [Candidatus Levybacteria bacterium]
ANTMSLYDQIKYKKFVFSFQDESSRSPAFAKASAGQADIKALDVKLSKFSISFGVSVFGRKYKFSNIKLIGIQNVENLLPGIFLGLYLGIDFSLIRKQIAKLSPLPRTMDASRTAAGVILINDTYNTHINSTRTAIEYMKLYKGKRILVLEPFSELGKNAYQDHLELGKEIGKVCDYLFLTNDNYYKLLISGIAQEKSLCLVQVWPPVKIAKFIEKNVGASDVVVFEGREAYNSFSLIASEPVFGL